MRQHRADIPECRAEIPECLNIEKRSQQYPFHRNFPFVHTTILHFQLRNLLWATSCHSLYVVHGHSIKHWDVITEAHRTVIDLSGNDQALHSVGQVQISTACVAHGLVAAGARLASCVPQTVSCKIEQVQISTACVAQGLVAAGAQPGSVSRKTCPAKRVLQNVERCAALPTPPRRCRRFRGAADAAVPPGHR